MRRKYYIDILVISLLIFIFALLSGYAHAERDVPDDNLSYPVLFSADVSAKESINASGFYFLTDKAVYFVTARHVLFKASSAKIAEQALKGVEVPDRLRHRIRYENRLLVFDGVMTQAERDDLIRYAKKIRHMWIALIKFIRVRKN